MSAHVLLNILNKLGERDKKLLSLFRNEFNKFNNTGARMLDSIYHITFFFKEAVHLTHFCFTSLGVKLF